MKKYLIISIVNITLACNSNEKLGFSEYKLGIESKNNGLRLDQVKGNAEHKEGLKYYNELGIPNHASATFSRSTLNELDAKYKAFKQKYAENETKAIRSVTDRTIRIILFDMRLLESTEIADKELINYYALEFVRNGGYAPDHFYMVINYLEKEKLLDNNKMLTLKSYFKRFIQDYTIKKEKGIINMQNTTDKSLKKLYTFSMPFEQKILKDCQQILKEVENWNVEPFENPEIDYRTLLK